jgi:4-hydroxy-3-polyprenylbenzoate decarboxylase
MNRDGSTASVFSCGPQTGYNTGMTYPSLADFLESLRQNEELLLVETEVAPVLEVAEITRRVSQTGGPALLFGKIRGHEPPLVTNLLGTEARICRALGIESVEQLSGQIAELVAPAEPEGWLERLRPSPSRAMVGRVPPRVVKTGACQQIVRLASDVNLGELPAVQSGPEEAGRQLTAAQFFTADPESNLAFVGRYDLRVLDQNRLAACWLPYDEPARLLASYRQRDQRMPVAAVLGGDPAGLLAAMAPLPSHADISAVAGLLRGKARELVKCRTIGLEVPADAELVLEGYIDPAEPAVETGLLTGPGGLYERSRPAPVVHVTAITHRANPVVPAVIPGPAPDEACVVSQFLQRAFLPLVRLAIPELVDLELPLFGATRHWGLASIRKAYPGQARKVASALWGMRQFMLAKVLVVVDEEVDVRDQNQVWSAISAYVDPGRDVFFQEGPPSVLDPAGGSSTLGRRMAVDATAKLADEGCDAQPVVATMPEALRRLVSERWAAYGLGLGPVQE